MIPRGISPLIKRSIMPTIETFSPAYRTDPIDPGEAVWERVEEVASALGAKCEWGVEFRYQVGNIPGEGVTSHLAGKQCMILVLNPDMPDWNDHVIIHETTHAAMPQAAGHGAEFYTQLMENTYRLGDPELAAIIEGYQPNEHALHFARAMIDVENIFDVAKHLQSRFPNIQQPDPMTLWMWDMAQKGFVSDMGIGGR